MTLKDKIYQLCKEQNMTVRELEREAGLKERTIQHWDKSKPSANKLQKVACVLKVPIEELLSVYNPEFERLAYIEALRMENEELKKSTTVLSEEEQELVKLYRKADEHDKATIMMLLSRYKEDTVSAVGSSPTTGTKLREVQKNLASRLFFSTNITNLTVILCAILPFCCCSKRKRQNILLTKC